MTKTLLISAVIPVAITFFTATTIAVNAADSPTNAAAPLPRSDANGNPLRRAPTGHVSNYDEAKVGNYTLPDPLVLQNGKPVRDADTWFKQRRPEILKLYESEIYGRVPKGFGTKTTFEVVATDTNALDGKAIRKQVLVRFGNSVETSKTRNVRYTFPDSDSTNAPDSKGVDKLIAAVSKQPNGPEANLVLYLPVTHFKPVQVLLHLVFFGATPPPPAPNSTNARPRLGETGPIADILARGYGYATLRYTEIEGDSAATSLSGARKLALASGQTKPANNEWGTISAWAWGASRVMDYFETDQDVDANRIAVIGHSRLGKTVLWIGAQDPRVQLVFSSCSGEMGAALAQRDFGETVDDMAANFPWQFAGNFQKYAGHWNNMPVDAHMLIALNAPRPVFITGGTQDQWADPRGEFLAEVAAGPVYRLLGEKDLGTTESPPLDTALISGKLGFRYHTGGHTITAEDWKAFLDFADRHFNSER